MNSKAASEDLTSYWQQQMEAWQTSGQTQQAYCKANALSYHRFGYWRRKFRQQAQEAQSQKDSGFVPVTYSAHSQSAGLSLAFPSGLVLRGIAGDNLSLVYQLLGRRRNKIKCLFWEDNGFVLYYKSLAEEKFRWPRQGDELISLTGQQINWLLDGYDISRMQGHKKLHYDAVF